MDDSPEGTGFSDESGTSEAPEANRPATVKLAPGLYLVATPIGNLEDITLRALRILRSATRIACEDTRHSRKLLDHYGVRTPTISYHQHNEVSRAAQFVDELKQGAAIAVISDAGTPGISDPGAELVAAAIVAGIPVFPVPGASALLAAVIASGLSADDFRFAGFLPARAGERRTFLEALRNEPATLVVYETPHRIAESLADTAEILGAHRPAALARELTKLHEEFLRGTLGDLLQAVKARENLRGEMVLVIAGNNGDNTYATATAAASPASLAQAMKQLLAEGLTEKEALKRAARDRNQSRDDLYREWQRVKPRRS